MHDEQRFAAGILINTGAKLKVIPLIFEIIKKNYDNFIESLSLFAISRKSDAGYFQSFIQRACDCDSETAFMDFTACSEFDVMNQLQRIKIPTLILTANDDMITPAKYSRFLAEHIKRSICITIDKAGHFSPLEKPDKVNAAILKFITEALQL